MNVQTTAARERVKGPLVWRDMDQQALDRAYDQAVHAPNRERALAKNARRAAANSLWAERG